MTKKKKYSTIQTTDFQNMLTNIIINNNALVVQVKKVMSTLHAITLGGDIVRKDRFVSTGVFSLNGHDRSYIMSTKRDVLKVPTLGRESTTHTHTHTHNLYIYI